MPIIISLVISPYRGKLVYLLEFERKIPLSAPACVVVPSRLVRSLWEGRLFRRRRGTMRNAFPLARLRSRCILQVVPH